MNYLAPSVSSAAVEKPGCWWYLTIFLIRLVPVNWCSESRAPSDSGSVMSQEYLVGVSGIPVASHQGCVCVRSALLLRAM